MLSIRLKKVHLGLIALAMIAFSSPASADDFAVDFGLKALHWIAYGTTSPVWGEKSLLSVLSVVLNAVALCVMAWLAVIGGTNFVIQTANKGVPGGQVISSFWMPLRIGIATILLIPLTSGFSTLQYGVITVAEKGNEHGNYLMGVGLDYLYDFGAYRSPALQDGRSTVLSWIESEVCRQYINSYTHKQTITPTVSKQTKTYKIINKLAYGYNEERTWSWSSNPRNDYCGAIEFSIEKSLGAPEKPVAISFTSDQTAAYGGPAFIGQKQAEIITQVQPRIAEIASMLLADENALRALQENGQSSQSTYEQAANEVNGKINQAVSKFNEAVILYNSLTQAAVASVVNKLNDAKNAHKNDNAGGWREQTKSVGWPALGTIFWQININQSEINKLASTMAAIVTPPQLDKEWLDDPRLSEISGRIRGLNKASGGIESTQVSETNIPSLSAIADAGAEGEGVIDSIKSAVYSAFAWTMRGMLYKNSPDDMLINLQYFGSAAGTASEVGWWAKTIAVSTVVGTLDGVNKSVEAAAGFSDYNPIGWVAKLASGPAAGLVSGIKHFLGEVSQLVDYLLMALIFVGFLLGVVLPTIPLTSWFMGVMSWLLFYIECLLVSPMWLSAHGTAEREGWGSEHTRQGYMLMIGLYLNPILRVAGFFGIFMLLRPAAYLVSWFIDYLQGVVVSGFTFFFITIGALVVSGIFAYNLLSRIFNLHSELFERGLRWVNGGHEVTGDGSSEEKARHNMIGFVNNAKTVTMKGRGMPSGKPKEAGGKGEMKPIQPGSND